MPTLLLNGAEDDLVGPADAAELAASIPGSRQCVYQKTGHFVLWERPEWVARELVSFVNEPKAENVGNVAFST